MSGTLRQRRGDRDKEFAEKLEKERLVEDINEMLTKMKRQPKPGLTNEAKAAKDALAADPYNLMNILELGKAYAVDEQWAQAANVLLRGWKRVDEFEDLALRYQFLGVLCTASLHTEKYKQALAVLNDVGEAPPEGSFPKMFHVLACQVYCHNGDQQKGLKSFHTAIEGENFDGAAPVWVACASALKKVGLMEVTKGTMEGLCENAEEKGKLDAMENIAAMKELVQEKPVSPSARYIIGGMIAVVFVIFVYAMHVLETQSLAQLAGGKASRR